MHSTTDEDGFVWNILQTGYLWEMERNSCYEGVLDGCTFGS